MGNAQPVGVGHGIMGKVHCDLFECPVCFEIPCGEIYQCKNGHSICGTCSRGVPLCPQCKLPLGEDQIRNRSLEAVIAGMVINCKYRDQGCKAQMARKDVVAHLENFCEFGPIVSVNFCKMLGVTGCNFVGRHAPDIYNHFVGCQSHVTLPGEIVCGTAFKTSLVCALEYMRTSKENSLTYWAFDVFSRHHHPNKSFKCIICVNIDMKQGDYSITSLLLERDEATALVVTMEINAPAKSASWKWSGKPTHYYKTESLLRNPPFKIGIPCLLELFGQAGEEMNCTITFACPQ